MGVSDDSTPMKAQSSHSQIRLAETIWCTLQVAVDVIYLYTYGVCVCVQLGVMGSSVIGSLIIYTSGYVYPTHIRPTELI